MKVIPYLFCMLLLLVACKRDEPETPQDHCAGYAVPSARILMDQMVRVGEFFHAPGNDQLTTEDQLQFRSEHTGGQYQHTWYIGADTVYTDKVWRAFYEEPRPGTYTVLHAMRWTPNLRCNPNDDGYDSSSFTFTITGKYMDLNVMGKFRVAFDTATNDSVDIEFYFSKFGYRDSVVRNPICGRYSDYDGDVGLAESAVFRVRGLKLKSLADNKYYETNLVSLNAGYCTISNNYILFENDYQSNSMGKGYFLVNEKSGICESEFYNRRNRYQLKGRKL